MTLNNVSPVDVTGWSTIRSEELGKDASKVWIAAEGDLSRQDWWLWKPRLSTGDGTQDRLNHVAEVVVSRLASEIGLPAAQCEFAVRNGVPGSISRMVAPHPIDMVPGGNLVREHALAEIRDALRGRRGPPGCEDRTAFEVFTGYLILDAWVANTDRHEQNWAVLEDTSTGESWLAPAFDHGSALGSGLIDANRERRSPEAFCKAGQTRYYGPRRMGLVDLANEAAQASGAYFWAERVASVDPDKWRGILENIVGLSVVARTFTDEVLTINQKRVERQCKP